MVHIRRSIGNRTKTHAPSQQEKTGMPSVDYLHFILGDEIPAEDNPRIKIPANRCEKLRNGDRIFLFTTLDSQTSAPVGFIVVDYRGQVEPDGTREIGGPYFAHERTVCTIRPSLLRRFDYHLFISERNRPRCNYKEQSGPLKDKHDFRVRVKGTGGIQFE